MLLFVLSPVAIAAAAEAEATKKNSIAKASKTGKKTETPHAHGRGAKSGKTAKKKKKEKGIGATICNKLGGAVNPGSSNCQSMLWTPTTNSMMPCYAYGGSADPCALDINNDKPDAGMSKDPSNCIPDKISDKTFYLWNEPDTNGNGTVCSDDPNVMD